MRWLAPDQRDQGRSQYQDQRGQRGADAGVVGEAVAARAVERRAKLTPLAG